MILKGVHTRKDQRGKFLRKNLRYNHRHWSKGTSMHQKGHPRLLAIIFFLLSKIFIRLGTKNEVACVQSFVFKQSEVYFLEIEQFYLHTCLCHSNVVFVLYILI